MTLAHAFDPTPASAYSREVDEQLWRRYGVTSSDLFAGNVVAAAQRAGYSPAECADWLARVDGLE